jgi:hypothetical protein
LVYLQLPGLQQTVNQSVHIEHRNIASTEEEQHFFGRHFQVMATNHPTACEWTATFDFDGDPGHVRRSSRDTYLKNYAGLDGLGDR